jgi:hypothetical protein
LNARARRRWTDDEDFLLADQLGTATTATVAHRLDRSIAAIWSRASYLGLSPYSEDGRYTASEVARALGVHVNTVLLWCRRSYLKAEKIGHRSTSGMWRIPWDGITPLELHVSRAGSTVRLLVSQGRLQIRRRGRRSAQGQRATTMAFLA